MGRLTAVAGRYVSARRLWRSRAAWLGLAAAATVLFVACGGGTSASDDELTLGEAFDTDAEPMGDMPTDTESTGGSGDAARDFEIVLFETENHAEGEVLRLSQLRGRPVLVNFWFPSCPPCRAEMPDLESAFQKYRDDGLEFIGVQLVGLDSAEDGQLFVDEIGVTYALGADKTAEITRAYKVTNFPTTFFLDEDLNIVRKWAGFLNEAVLDEIILQLLN